MTTPETEKQELMLSYLASNSSLFIKCNPILVSSYFQPSLKPAISFIKSYFETYRGLPTVRQIHAETQVAIEPLELPPASQELKYAEHELESFCKSKAIEHAIFASVELHNEGKHAEIEKLIRDAVTVSIQRNLGLDYFEDPEARLQSLIDSNSMCPTLMTKLDEALGGGINRKEMIIFAAPSGVGKSITMLNLGVNLMSQGLHGIYITLELSEEVVAKRLDSMLTGISQGNILNNITKVGIEVRKVKSDKHYGGLQIKRMPESATNANHIRAYLKEYELVHGKAPDFVIVDYIDIMASCEKVSVENQFIKDKHVCEELRAIANDYDLMMISASQLNRGAQQIESLDDLNQGHIAGGISKINTTDNLVAIIQTAQMKARNEMMFKMLKTRSSGGVGSYFMMNFNPISLRQTNLEDEAPSQTIASRVSAFKDRAQTKVADPPPGPAKTPKAGFGDLFNV